MTSFDTLQTISSRLNELASQLSSEKLSKEELEEFEILSRKLYERAVILNYKAKEESVYEKNPELTTTKASSFSMEFDKAEESEEQSFEINEEVVEVQEKPSIEKESEQAPEEVPNTKVRLDEGRIQFDFSDDFDVLETEPVSPPESHSIEENKEEKEHKETLPPPSVEESESINEKTSSFYELFLKAQKATAGDMLGTSKIESLKGAIGLNDRLQFINELFGNDSDSYNKTIDLLDQLESSKDALLKLSEIAVEENWHEDSSTVNEFVHLINRRYVD